MKTIAYYHADGGSLYFNHKGLADLSLFGIPRDAFDRLPGEERQLTLEDGRPIWVKNNQRGDLHIVFFCEEPQP